MNSLLYNSELVAIPGREQAIATSLPVDIYKTFGTEYGMFIPITQTAYQLIRWVRRGMVDILPKKSIMGYLIHISNDGEVIVVVADTEADQITMVPYCGKRFLRLHPLREVSEAYSTLLENCTTVTEAVAIVDQGCPEGFYDPTIFFVDEWVKYAKEKGYTKLFYNTTFSK
jgi:hypothetical protein